MILNFAVFLYFLWLHGVVSEGKLSEHRNRASYKNKTSGKHISEILGMNECDREATTFAILTRNVQIA